MNSQIEIPDNVHTCLYVRDGQTLTSTGVHSTSRKQVQMSQEEQPANTDSSRWSSMEVSLEASLGITGKYL